MSTQKQVVVVAGAGDVASYLAEEFIQDGTYELVIMSRRDQGFFEKLGVTCRKIASYAKEDVLPVLNSYNTRALISTIHTDDPESYTSTHKSLLEACRESKTCKHYMPSEFVGNLRTGIHVPRGMSRARSEFRSLLAKETEVKWTLLNQGWLADYFVQIPDGSKSYIGPFPAGWPIDMEKKTVRLIGSGNEPIGWTTARDVAKAAVKLVGFDDWPDHTYVFGELATWNEAIEKVERFHGIKLEVRFPEFTTQIKLC